MIDVVVSDLPDTWKGHAPRCNVCANPAYQHYRCNHCRGDYYCSEWCHNAFHRAKRQVYTQNKRTSAKGYHSTLKLSEFLATLRYFHGRCAYCQKIRYENIDHFIPVKAGGGTTQQNCLPCCRDCNTRKDRFSGEHLRYIFSDEVYLRIRQYVDIRTNV